MMMFHWLAKIFLRWLKLSSKNSHGDMIIETHLHIYNFLIDTYAIVIII
jgi:hypothetical protein